MKTTILNPAQVAAVQSNAESILCLASPGSGKTRTLIARIARLIQAGTSPSEIACITFTNNAATEITQRLQSLYFDGGITLGYSGTLHGFLLRLIQQNYAALGYRKASIGIIDGTQADDLMERCCVRMGYKGPKRAVHEALTRKLTATRQGLPEIVAIAYAMELLSNGLLTFDMILSEGERLLDASPDATNQYKHLLIDEYQDSSDIDARIYSELKIPNKFRVGDDDQAIYGFRGGSVKHILTLAWDPETEVHRLEINYRSDVSICEAAQRLIAHNQYRVRKSIVPDSTARGSVQVVECDGVEAEHEIVLTAIKNSPGTSAILVRTNHLCDEWKNLLVGHGIPVASREVLKRPEDWKKAKTALALFNDPENDFLAFWLIRDIWGKERAAASKREAAAARQSLNKKFLNIPPDLESTLYGPLLARLGISQESITIIEDTLRDMPGASGTALMAALAQAENETTQMGQGVTVSTIHSAKGKEWDCVALPAFEDGIIPSAAKSADLEECRRLAFVAITRAKHELLITHCKQRKPAFGSWKPVPAKPSRFIQEMGVL